MPERGTSIVSGVFLYSWLQAGRLPQLCTVLLHEKLKGVAWPHIEPWQGGRVEV